MADDWTTEQQSSFLFLTGNQDMDAINVYMHSQPLNTAEATALFNDWVSWFDTLGWFSKNVDTSTYDIARNKRDAFNLANAISEEDKAAVQATMKTGQSTEVNDGNTSRKNSEGKFPTAPFQLIPTWLKYAAGGLAGVTLIASAVSFSAVKAYKP